MKAKLLIAALGVGLSSPTLAADIYKGDVIVQHYGNWEAKEQLSDDGWPLCYAQTTGEDRFFAIKYQYGSDNMFFHLFKIGWKLPDHMQVDVNMQVDNGPTITYPMVARDGHDGYSVLEYDFTRHKDPNTGEYYLDEFVDRIRSGTNVKFSFPQGDEPTWVESLDGIDPAFSGMATCMNVLYQKEKKL